VSVSGSYCVVKGINPGTVKIKVTTKDGSKSDQIDVKVYNPTIAVQSITTNPVFVNVQFSKSTTVAVVFTPSNATNKQFECNIANTAIATASVSNDGRSCYVKGIKNGTTTLEVVSKADRTKKKSISIYVTGTIATVAHAGAVWNHIDEAYIADKGNTLDGYIRFSSTYNIKKLELRLSETDGSYKNDDVKYDTKISSTTRPNCNALENTLGKGHVFSRNKGYYLDNINSKEYTLHLCAWSQQRVKYRLHYQDGSIDTGEVHIKPRA